MCDNNLLTDVTDAYELRFYMKAMVTWKLYFFIRKASMSANVGVFMLPQKKKNIIEMA